MGPEDFAGAGKLASASIPIIDIAAALGGDRDAVVREIVDAATAVGFFYVTGHGIDPTLARRAFAAARDFFDAHTDAPIDPRDLGIAREDSRYEPVTAGARIVARNRRSCARYGARRESSTDVPSTR